MNFKLIFPALIFSTLVLTNCSSLNKKLHKPALQTVNFVAVDNQTLTVISDAKCSLTTSIGESFDVKGNPGSATVGTGQNQLIVNCQAPNYLQQSIAVANSTSQIDWSNLKTLPGHISNIIRGQTGKFPSNVVVLMARPGQYPSPTRSDEAYRANYENSVFFQGKTVQTQTEEE